MNRTLRILAIGLGLTFLANSLTALFASSDFIDIVSNSFLTTAFHFNPDIFVKFIAINDGIVALLLISGIGIKWVSRWAVLWIIGVMVLSGISLDTLEHFGFLTMAIAIAFYG